MEKKIILFLFCTSFFFFSCKHVEEFKILKIGDKFQPANFVNLQSCPTIITENGYQVIQKAYTCFDYLKETKIVYLVDENNIIRRITIYPIDMCGIHKTYETPEGYSIYTDINELDLSKIQAFFCCPFIGDMILLKSGWCLSFFEELPPNDFDIRVKCSVTKLDINYFNLLKEKIRLKKITEEWNQKYMEKIQQEIKREGIPYG